MGMHMPGGGGVPLRVFLFMGLFLAWVGLFPAWHVYPFHFHNLRDQKNR